MRAEFLDILVEPDSHLPLLLEAAVREGSDIIAGTLRSQSGKSYPVIKGIPRFVKSENYANSFGLQWNQFSKTQLDSVNGCNYSRSRFYNEVRWNGQWAKEKWVLDAGCGAGRFTEIVAELGCNVVAVDMSNAVEAAQVNLSRFQNVHFVQADINHLPFCPRTFDGLYSIGVLQHTPDPLAALVTMLAMLSRGGRFAFTAYARLPWTKLYSKYWTRKMVSSLSKERLLQLIEGIMPVAFRVTNILFRMPLLNKFFRFLIPIANYVERTQMSERHRYEEAILDTFDMLSPKYDNPVTWTSVAEVLRKQRIKEYKVLSKRPVNVIGCC